MKRSDTINVLLEAGKLAGTYIIKGILDTQYTRAVGVVAYINRKPADLATLQLGIRNDSEVFVSPTNIDHLRAGVECDKRGRLTPVSIPCDNRNLSITVILPVDLSDDLDVDVVFELEKGA